METWQELAQSQSQTCPTCYGEGTHGTGQSGIGDVYCEECGASGSIGPSAEEVKKSSEPESPRSPIYDIQAREQQMLRGELYARGIQEPLEEFGVYARFIRSDNKE